MNTFRKLIAILLLMTCLLSLCSQALASEEPPAEEVNTESPWDEDFGENIYEDIAEETPDETIDEPEDELTEQLFEELSDEPEAVADEAAEESDGGEAADTWIVPGASDSSIMDGGTTLKAGNGCYYSDGGIWLETARGTTYLTSDDAGNLNLSGDWLYYTVDSGAVRRIPMGGGNAETVYDHGSHIRQLYVIGQELRFVSGGMAWSYSMTSCELKPLDAPADVMALIPTEYGTFYLTGAVRDYDLYAETSYCISGVQTCYTDSGYLVINTAEQTLQSALENAFSGGFHTEPYALHRAELLAEDTGLSESEQLANEAAYLQSEEYLAFQDGLSFDLDGASYYKATNSNIAELASGDATSNQTNIIRRARQMAEVKWTPLKDRYSWGGNDDTYVQNNKSWGSKVVDVDDYVTYGYFKAGHTYQGIPYSQAVYTGYVGWSLSISGFVNAVNSSSSKFYSGYSKYSRTAPYYGSDCSGFVSWAWDLPYRCTCTSLLNYSTKIGTSLGYMRVGDCINNPNSHVVLVTDIGYDKDGYVVSVEITEQTPSKMRVTCYGELIPGKTYHYTGTLAYFRSYYFNNGYAIYRRSYSGSVSFKEDPAVNLEESGYAAAPKISVAVNDDGSAKVVTLTHSNSSAVIYYTTDGTDPTTSSTKYTEPFELTETAQVKAIAAGESYTGSYTLDYTVTVSRAKTPFLALAGEEDYASGSFVSHGAHIVFINENNDDVYYTTDGTTPTKNSNKMPLSGIEITKETTFKAVAVSSKDLNSEVASVTVKIGSFHEVTAAIDGDGGVIQPSTGVIGVLDGTDYTLTFVPDDHYSLSDVIVDGKSIGAQSSYTLENVKTNHTVSVKFKVDLPFEDAASGWYTNAVAFAYAKSLFAGTSSTTFSPEDYMTRGMFITVLGRFAGAGSDLESWSGTLGITNGNYIYIREKTSTQETSRIITQTGYLGEHLHVLDSVSSGVDGYPWYKVTYGDSTGYMRKYLDGSSGKQLLLPYTGTFTDLPNGAYYTGYAQWAYIKGIMNGIDSDTFGSMNNISRQDICVLFYRYLTSTMGRTLSSTSTAFLDDDNIADYASTAVYALKNIGIINGYAEEGGYSFHPNSPATRAEVATMFMKLYNYLNYSGTGG